MTDPRYPIGPYVSPASVDAAAREASIRELASAPVRLRDALEGLEGDRLDTPYREGGWTVRQVAHHLPDSHLNAYLRFKLALTEDEPTIKPYHEELWAELPEARSADPRVSVALLEALHERWVLMMRAMEPRDWARRFRHPERGPMSLDETLALYAWHGRHHVGQILGLRERMGWS
jgi:uncharacterized damage-inducible protein DinB